MLARSLHGSLHQLAPALARACALVSAHMLCLHGGLHGACTSLHQGLHGKRLVPPLLLLAPKLAPSLHRPDFRLHHESKSSVIATRHSIILGGLYSPIRGYSVGVLAEVDKDSEAFAADFGSRATGSRWVPAASRCVSVGVNANPFVCTQCF